MSTADLLLLQGKCKTDPDGYKDEFLMRLRHYKSLLGIFSLTPSKDHKEFSDLISFMAQLSASYRKDLASLPKELIDLLARSPLNASEANHAVLDPALRRTIAQALILLKNRGVVETSTLVPIFFRLFRVNDKTLRQLLFRHIVTDIKTANKKRKADQLNRAVQSFLHSIILDEHVRTAKRAVSLLAELYRRNVWSDANTVNILAAAVFHKNPSVMVAALKFFAGQDDGDEDAEDESDSEGDHRTAAGKRRSAEAMGAVGLSREDVYKAYSKGTLSSKKKKQAKLKREIVKVRKRAKREEGVTAGDGHFSAIMLLHDPQGFAEKLFGRIHSGGGDSWDAKLLALQVLSRLVGMHKLQVLNFYPLLQRYVQPQQRDATKILACAAQACHDQVPPDAMEPLVRQLVNAFVHDRARPEVMAVGLSTVREIAVRAPLVMTPELLQDLAMYKRNKDKAVATAARSVILLFREMAPSLLSKKDRGKGHEKERTLPQFGASQVRDRIDGAELLEQAILRGSDGEGSDGDDGGSDGEEGSDDDDDGGGGASGSGSDGEGGSGDEMEVEESDGDDDDEEEEEEEDAAPGRKGVKRARESDAGGADSDGEAAEPAAKRAATEGSLRQLKRAAAASKADELGADAAMPIEQGRFLGPEDFTRIKALKADAAMKVALAKYGAKSAAHKGAAEVAAALSRHASTQHQRRVNPDSLYGTHKKHSDYNDRLATVLAGREGREEFGSSVARKKKKVGGSSNKEKDKKKALPLAAVKSQASKRFQKMLSNRKNKKNFGGKKMYTK